MSERVQERISERESLLGSAVEMLKGDARVRAAWMFGSIGEGREDAWSDLDIHVVLEDEAYAEVVADRLRFAERLGPSLLFVEQPLNACPGGHYLMSVHDAPTGPHAVDWQFQPALYARRTASRRVLVDRRPICDGDVPHVDPPSWRLTPEQDDLNKAALFWAMLMIQGKYVARDPEAAGMAFESFILSLLGDVAAVRNRTIDSATDSTVSDPARKLDRLRRHAAAMAQAAPEASGPYHAVDRFLGFILEVVCGSSFLEG